MSQNTVRSDSSPGADDGSAGRGALQPFDSGSMYDALRSIAARQIQANSGQRRPRDFTLQPTAIVHEAYAKLAEASNLRVESRAHFFSLAAAAMRQVLIDYARSQSREKRGGDWQRVAIDASEMSSAAGDANSADASLDVLALENAMIELGRLDPRAAEIVNLRFFAGLSERVIAEHLGISERTVRNDWRTAKAWLAQRVRGEGVDDASRRAAAE